MPSGITEQAFIRIMGETGLDRPTRLRKMARLMGLSKGARLRLEWILYQEAYGTVHTCHHFGIARKTFSKWHHRFDERCLTSLEEHPRAPKRRRVAQITSVEEQRIVALRKEFIRYGKMKLAVRYEEQYGAKISSWKVQKVIERYALYYHPVRNARIQAKRKRSFEKRRITELTLKPKLFFLFRIDTVVRYWNGMKRYILTAIDVTSRLAFAHMYTSHSSATAADFLKRLHLLTEGKLQNIQTDNGSEFHKHFEQAMHELHLTHYWSRVRTPKDNAHNERFNRTLQEEFIDLGNAYDDPVVFNRKLTQWLIEYNFHRPHQSLGYRTPMYLIQQKKGLLPMYPSSTAI